MSNTFEDEFYENIVNKGQNMGIGNVRICTELCKLDIYYGDNISNCKVTNKNNHFYISKNEIDPKFGNNYITFNDTTTVSKDGPTDAKYNLEYIDFILPSNNSLKSVKYPIEINLVHKSSSGLTIIIAIFLQKSESLSKNDDDIKRDALLNNIVKKLPLKDKDNKSDNFTDRWNLTTLLPANDKRSFYTYILPNNDYRNTKYPNILWIIFDNPLNISNTLYTNITTKLDMEHIKNEEEHNKIYSINKNVDNLEVYASKNETIQKNDTYNYNTSNIGASTNTSKNDTINKSSISSLMADSSTNTDTNNETNNTSNVTSSSSSNKHKHELLWILLPAILLVSNFIMFLLWLGGALKSSLIPIITFILANILTIILPIISYYTYSYSLHKTLWYLPVSIGIIIFMFGSMFGPFFYKLYIIYDIFKTAYDVAMSDFNNTGLYDALKTKLLNKYDMNITDLEKPEIIKILFDKFGIKLDINDITNNTLFSKLKYAISYLIGRGIRTAINETSKNKENKSNILGKHFKNKQNNTAGNL